MGCLILLILFIVVSIVDQKDALMVLGVLIVGWLLGLIDGNGNG